MVPNLHMRCAHCQNFQVPKSESSNIPDAKTIVRSRWAVPIPVITLNRIPARLTSVSGDSVCTCVCSDIIWIQLRIHHRPGRRNNAITHRWIAAAYARRTTAAA